MTGSRSDPARAWSVRGPLTMGLIALIALLGGFGGWAMTSTLAGAVVASGQIEVDRNRQTIQHPDGGVVAAILVGEGDRVAEDDILMRLDPSRVASDLSVARAQLFEVRARRTRLEAERDGLDLLTFAPDLRAMAADSADLVDLMLGQANLFDARRAVRDREVEHLYGRMTQIAAQMSGLDAQEAAMQEQLSLTLADLDRVSDLLDRGLGRSDSVMQLQLSAARMQGTLGEMVARRAEAAERVIETELAITQLESERVEQAIAQLREVRVSEEELRERLAVLTRQLANLDLRAPVAGRIHGLQVFGPQSVIRAADPVAFLVPEGRPLVISTRVPAIHVDQVFVGQSVTLRFPAFDLSDIPDLVGHVTTVSADAFTDEVSGASFYRTEVVLNEGEIARLEDRTLLPGMPVEAYIRTEDRTPMTYLLEPIAAYFNRAFRES